MVNIDVSHLVAIVSSDINLTDSTEPTSEKAEEQRLLILYDKLVAVMETHALRATT